MESFSRLARLLSVILPPLLLGVFLYFLIREPLDWWLHGEEIYDDQTMKEWVREARVGFRTLPEMLKEFTQISTKSSEQLGQAKDNPIVVENVLYQHGQKREEIQETLKVLGSPSMKIYAGQLPLFPVIYRLEINFDPAFKARFDSRLHFEPISWDAELPRHPNQFRELVPYPLLPEGGATVRVEYHLHAYQQKQFKEREDAVRRMWVTIGVVVLLGFGLSWIYLAQRRYRERERQRLLAEQKINAAEKGHLQEELRRQEAESQALALKSQMFLNIGIMAKSYAHNIKNLLVRPNDLLRRCIEDEPEVSERQEMLIEIKEKLATVTERLQEILQTVQRDPSKFERRPIDLNALARDLHRTWADQARDKWKMILELDLTEGSLEVMGDRSHLQQAVENFIFNARDAVAEMRNHLRKQARPDPTRPPDAAQREAMIAAAGWRGRVIVRTRQAEGHVDLEVQDNGIGMTEEVRRHCTEPHFTTKRDNALYAGLSAGMGLGLSFVQTTLDHQGAHLEIDSQPYQGATFRIRFSGEYVSIRAK